MHDTYIALGVDKAGIHLMLAPMKNGCLVSPVSIILGNVEVLGVAEFSRQLGHILLVALAPYQPDIRRYPLLPDPPGLSPFALGPPPFEPDREMRARHMGLDLERRPDKRNPMLGLQAYDGAQPTSPAEVQAVVWLATLERGSAASIIGERMLGRLAAMHPDVRALAGFHCAIDAGPVAVRPADPPNPRDALSLSTQWALPRHIMASARIALGVNLDGTVLLSSPTVTARKTSAFPKMIADLAQLNKREGVMWIAADLMVLLKFYRSEVHRYMFLHRSKTDKLIRGSPLPPGACTEPRALQVALDLRQDADDLILLLQAYDGDRAIGPAEEYSFGRLAELDEAAPVFIIGERMLGKLSAMHPDVAALAAFVD